MSHSELSSHGWLRNVPIIHIEVHFRPDVAQFSLFQHHRGHCTVASLARGLLFTWALLVKQIRHLLDAGTVAEAEVGYFLLLSEIFPHSPKEIPLEFVHPHPVSWHFLWERF